MISGNVWKRKMNKFDDEKATLTTLHPVPSVKGWAPPIIPTMDEHLQEGKTLDLKLVSFT